jgi:hypothetical protein
MMNAKRATPVVVTILLGATGLGAQELPVTVEAEYEEGFGLLTAVRELPDGRVLVADPLGQLLAALDMTSGEMEMWGREGAGPQEYKQPDAVYALPGDSTLLVDLGNGRLTTIAPDGRFGRTMPLASGGGQGPGSLQMLIPGDVDGAGNIYFTQRSFRSPNDSSTVMRYDRGSGEATAVARVKPADVEQSGSQGNVSIQQVPMSPRDGFGVGADGTIALVRSDGYFVEVVRPDGTTARGPSVDYDPIRPRDAEKEAWLEAGAASGLSISISMQNNERTMAFSRGGGGGGAPDLNQLNWPDRMPAFVAGSVEVGPDGRIWVARTVRAGEPSHFDVFDANGRILGYATFGPRTSIVGFGEGGAVYLAETDDFGLQWLKKVKVG